MATVLFVWELGAGLGHLGPLAPLISGMSERRHRVFAALKDLARVHEVIADGRVSYLPSPLRLSRRVGARTHAFWNRGGWANSGGAKHQPFRLNVIAACFNETRGCEHPPYTHHTSFFFVCSVLSVVGPDCASDSAE